MPATGSETVVLVLVESVSKIWVTRKVEESKVEKLMAALQKMIPKLIAVEEAELGCVYGARFNEDGVMYRAVVEEQEGRKVRVRFIDYGNCEIKVADELVHLPKKMGTYPAAAHIVQIE